MPRSIWSGAISFGLVNVPVKLFSAVSRKTVRFHQLHAEDGVRIQQKRICPADGEEVSYDQIVKGFELTKDRYVVVTKDELDTLDPKASRTIDIEEFVELSEIDPIYFDNSYYLTPATGAEKAYVLLVQAMEAAGKAAIARFVMRQKEYVGALRPRDGVLALSTMVFHDEVVSPDSLEERPDDDIEATDRELKMARQLIESLSEDWEPDKYEDSYRERVLELIEKKAAGEEIAVQPQAEAPEEVPDLMAALEASISAAKGEDDDGGGNGASASKSKSKSKSGGAKKSGGGSSKRSKQTTKS
jgi:DNA end-binding protein Ku